MASKDPVDVYGSAHKWAVKQACADLKYLAIGAKVTRDLKKSIPKRTGEFANSIVMGTSSGHWATDIYIGTDHDLAYPIEFGHLHPLPKKKNATGTRIRWTEGNHAFTNFVKNAGGK